MIDELQIDKQITGQIVAAIFAAGGQGVDAEGVPMSAQNLIKTVFETVSALGVPEFAEVIDTAEPIPAVSIKASVKPDHVTCLECGYKAKMLKRHISAGHGLTVDEYRAKWGLAKDHALTAPTYSKKRRELALGIGLGQPLKGKVRRAA